MSAGLMIWDQNGNIILDATYRIARIIGSQPLSNGVSGSVTDSRLAQGGFVSFQPSVCIGEGYQSGGVICPQFTFSGSTLYWSYAAKNNAAYDIFQDGILFYGAS